MTKTTFKVDRRGLVEGSPAAQVHEENVVATLNDKKVEPLESLSARRRKPAVRDMLVQTALGEETYKKLFMLKMDTKITIKELVAFAVEDMLERYGY